MRMPWDLAPHQGVVGLGTPPGCVRANLNAGGIVFWFRFVLLLPRYVPPRTNDSVPSDHFTILALVSGTLSPCASLFNSPFSSTAHRHRTVAPVFNLTRCLPTSSYCSWSYSTSCVAASNGLLWIERKFGILTKFKSVPIFWLCRCVAWAWAWSGVWKN